MRVFNFVKNYSELWICLFVVLLSTGLLFFMGAQGWQGRLDGCLVNGQCFCELDRGGLIRQYTNTFSNVAFVLVGLAIAWFIAWERQCGVKRESNLMTQTKFYPGFYAVIVCLIGPSSMALHASLTWWGSVLDLAAMNIFIAFVFSYALVRWKHLSVKFFILSFFIVTSILMAIKIIHGYGSGAFAAMIILSVFVEIRLRKEQRIKTQAQYMWASGLSFLAAIVVWSLSKNEGLLCVPESLWQGHGFWHIACAVSTGFLFLYMRSERHEEIRIV